MDSKDNSSPATNRLLKSFSFAISGIYHSVRTERNLQIHLFISLIVVVMSILLPVTKLELLILFLVIGAVISLELMNTAIERTVDLVTEDVHPLAKQAKDAGAGAVMVFAIIAVIVGITIFGPYLWEWWFR